MTLAITLNIILSAVVFTAIVGMLAAATRPSRRVIMLTTSARHSANRTAPASAPAPVVA